MTKPVVFYFHFAIEQDSDEDESLIVAKGFIFKPEGIEKLGEVAASHGYARNAAGFIDNLCGKLAEPIESQFGVHDWSTSPSDLVDAIGYTTYEVAPDMIDAVMQDWHDKFSEITGGGVSAVVAFEEHHMHDDHDIYQAIQAKLDAAKRPSI